MALESEADARSRYEPRWPLAKPRPSVRHGTCGCRHPLYWDSYHLIWRHLADGSACVPQLEPGGGWAGVDRSAGSSADLGG